MAYLCLGLLDEAIAEGKRTLQLDPNYIYETPILADAYREKGMFAEAIALFLKAQQITGAPQPGLAITYARMGRTAEARQILGEIKEVAAKKYIAAEEIAAVYVALGEKDEAFKWLEVACDDHGGAVQAVPVRPVFRLASFGSAFPGNRAANWNRSGGSARPRKKSAKVGAVHPTRLGD